MSLAVAYGMKKKMAKGGKVMCAEGCAMDHEHMYSEGGAVHEKLDYTEMKPGDRKGISRAGVHVREAARQRGFGDSDSMDRAKRQEGYAKKEHEHVLHDVRQEKSKDRTNLAKGGRVGDPEVKGYDYDHDTDSYLPNKNRSRDMANIKGTHVGHDFAVASGISTAGANIRSSKKFENAGRAVEHKITKENAHKEHHRVLGEMQEMSKHDRTNLAEGGDVKGVHEQITSGNFSDEGGVSHAGQLTRGAHRDKHKPMSKDYNSMKKSAARQLHEDKLHELKSMKKPDLYAEGGSVDHDNDDLVMSIMKKRYAEGGEVSNDTGDGQAADEMENQFDDMVLDSDQMHDADYTGENSGDEIGDEQEDEDQRDVVAQIMKSRKKKDHLPNPR